MLASVPQGHAFKVAIAREVRQFTPMTRAWIANALHMGSPSYLSALLAANSTAAAKVSVSTDSSAVFYAAQPMPLDHSPILSSSKRHNSNCRFYEASNRRPCAADENE
jgi:hypothetical protein